MPSVVEALSIGIGHQRAGRIAQAEAVYREILRFEPSNPDALHLLGLAAHEAGDDAAALEWIRTAVELRPAIAPFHSSLGTVLHAMRRFVEAREAFETAIRLDPKLAEARVNLGNLLQNLGLPLDAADEYEHALSLKPGVPEIHNNLGNAYLAMGRYAEAEKCFREALRLRPDYVDALVNLAAALHRLHRLEEAAACCREALVYRPATPEAHANLAAVLIGQRQWQAAEACCRDAVRLRPSFAEAWCNLGNVCVQLERHKDAEACCREALRWKPDHAESWNNLGNSLKDDDRLEEAVDCYRRALMLRPNYADALANLGVALYNQGRFSEALDSLDAAIRVQPSHADARFNRALLLLLTGCFEEGWREYEWRWKRPGSSARPDGPIWSGEPLAGRTILVTAEQGLGDTVQFVRYLPLLKQRGARVLFECPLSLVPLLSGLLDEAEIVLPGSGPPGFDVHCGLLSLPRFLGMAPGDSPYLSVDPERMEEWRRRLLPIESMRVGLAWAGNAQNPRDRLRSIPPQRLELLQDTPGVALFSLQKGASEKWLTQLDEPDHRLVDAAAMIMNLDLVITVDTMIAHLAGALGRPVWILLSHIPDWRWQLGGDGTPWYHSARLFRQTSIGDWSGVIRRVQKTLSSEAAKNSLKLPPALTIREIDGPGNKSRPDKMPGSKK
jgi:Flp pilus assembly protein TadD